MAMAGKKLAALEMPEEDEVPPATIHSAAPLPPPDEKTAARTLHHSGPQTIVLPPIPPAPVRRVMVQLSIKAPINLVERLEAMAAQTGAQKQAVIAAALDAYMRGHGY
jgi:hypothetical protein